MSTKHTPGPWQMSGVRSTSPIYKGHGVGPGNSTEFVVVVPYNDFDHVECIANARLIAAAPELLEALQEIMAERWTPAGRSERVSDLARAAIAKATGAA